MSYRKLINIFIFLAGLSVIVINSGKIFNKPIFDKSHDRKIVVLDNKTSFFTDYFDDFSYYSHDTIFDCYSIHNSKDKLIAKVLFTSPLCDDITGYGGSVPFAIIFNQKDVITDLFLLDNSETPSWLNSLEEKNFFESWNNLSIKDALNKKVDAVSGATLTSSAVINSIQKRLAAYTETQQTIKKRDWINVIAFILSFIILIFALISFLYPQKFSNLRIFLNIGLVGILGFWQAKFLSIALLHNWLVNGLNIETQLFIFIVLLLSIILPLVTNKSFYCQFVCPYGALQELAGKITKNKIQFDRPINRIFKSFRYIYLFIIFLMIILSTDLVLENFEPFGAFRYNFASLSTLIIAVLFLFLSVIINKPWCRYFCPTGALLSLLRSSTSKTGKLSDKKISLQLLLNIILGLSLIVMIYYNFMKNSGNKEFDSETKSSVIMSNNTLDVIHSRKSVRNFTEKAVTKEQLEILVKAGMAAPSARNLQPWAFIVITERKVLDDLADSLPYAKMLKQVSGAIVVCGDLSKAATDVDQAYWVQDCSAASQNILLAAESMGLGAVWTAVYPYEERINSVKKILSLPENIIPLNVIPVGYPTGIDKPKNKWKPENLHWNKW